MKRLVLGVAITVMAPAALASSNLDSSIYVAAEFTHTDFGISKSDFPAMSVGGTTFAPTDVDSQDSGTHFLVGLRPHRNFSFDVGGLGSVAWCHGYRVWQLFRRNRHSGELPHSAFGISEMRICKCCYLPNSHFSFLTGTMATGPG